MKKILKQLQYPLNYASWFTRYVKLVSGLNTLKDIKNINKELKEVNNNNVKLCIKAPKSIAKKISVSSFEIPIDSLKIEQTKEKVERQTISEILTEEEMTLEYLKIMDTEFDVNDLKMLSDEILEEARG